MVKKYLVEADSIFNKSLIYSLFEPGEFGFHIEGLTEVDVKDLFPKNKIKIIKDEIDLKSVPTKCVVAYLDENKDLKAFVLQSSSKKYYLFKIDHQKELQLNIHQKYISSDLKSLTDDFEKHCKTKGKNNFDGIGDFSDIKDIDFFENRYEENVKNQVDKTSNVYRLLFKVNNNFTSDFAYLVNNQTIRVVNIDEIDSKVLTLQSMQKHMKNRKDCLLINSETKDIEYFIFTYKPYLINHYYLFKNLGNDEFEFIMESISFNRVLSSIDIKYKKGSEFAAKEFAKMRYDNFYTEYVSFEEEEEFDEEVQEELKTKIDLLTIKKEFILDEVRNIVKENKLPLDINLTFHGKVRIRERIGEMKEDDMLALAKVAYEKGKNSVYFLEKDPMMFKFLQHQQNKRRGKTLRIYQDILFFYTLEPPHDLVTCFPYKSNYEMYVKKVNR